MGEETEKTNKVGVVATMSKKPRPRKKLLYQALKKQMEFYFSDVNISKDRFMSELLQKSPYVDLSIFLNFNKIKSMTTKVKHIANALQSSDLLKVSEDGTKVFRTRPPQQKENSNECTIYVEQIPVDADHGWLMDIFQTYGPIDYVSIPKFKHSRKNKGFAFIEFKDPQSAKNALAAFSEIGCRLSNQMDPGNLCSIRTFDENESEIINNKTYIESPKEESVDVLTSTDQSDLNNQNCDIGGSLNEISDKNIKNENNSRKRKHEPESSSCNKNVDDCDLLKENLESVITISNKEVKEEINHRKRKHPESEQANDDFGKKRVTEEDFDESARDDERTTEDTLVGEHFNRKRKHSEINKSDSFHNDSGEDKENDTVEESELLQNDETFEEADESACDAAKEISSLNVEEYEVNNDDERRKKNRKRKKKHRKSKTADNSYGLQILSKMEWKALRNKYLNEQRRKMKELKQYIRYKRFNDNRPSAHCNRNYNEMVSKIKTENVSADCEKFEKSNAVDGNEESNEKLQLSGRLTLTPGLIVKVTLPEPVLNKSSFKNEAKIFQEVKYIDVREGSNIAFLRFSSPSAAEQCVQSGHWPNVEIIRDDEEKAYWHKIAIEREEKLTKGRSVKRGRDKLLKKAEDMHIKHIWFD